MYCFFDKTDHMVGRLLQLINAKIEKFYTFRLGKVWNAVTGA